MKKNNEHQYRQNEQDRRIALIEEHIIIYNKEMGDVKSDISKIMTDVSWLKQYFWIVAGSTISAFIIGIINLLFK